ncbi:MAG: glucosamine-6-phosphate deaminase [Patescibacteria group bacterium]
MKIIIAKNYSQLSKKAAAVALNQINNNPQSVLGLPTGSTPLGMYKNLAKACKNKKVDFKKVTAFNLDEYVGLAPSQPQSYHYYMFNNLFNHININHQKINIPNGLAKDIKKHCHKYERKIKKAGGFDLMILGVGQNGHIGFNEPGASFNSATHLVNLTPDTISANSRFFKSKNDVPKKAITIGLKTIMSAKKIILLASGRNKAAIIAKMITGQISKNIPASVLHRHKNVTLIIDNAAASILSSKHFNN